jgi:hypothetical protein
MYLGKLEGTNQLFVIQDLRIYRGIELVTDHYLLRAKVNFPPQWVKKKVSVSQEAFLK